MLPKDIKTSWRSAMLVVTPTVSLTFSSWKWHFWHSLSKSNIFSSVGASSPSLKQTAAAKAMCPKFFPHCQQLAVTRLHDFITPEYSEKLSYALFSTVFSSSLLHSTLLDLLQPTPECPEDVAVGYYFLTYCNARHWTFHSNDGQGHVSTLSLSRKRSLISSVPHAVLDDKMAAVAVLAVLMWRPDNTNFIYCHCAAGSVPYNHSLQLLTFSQRDVLDCRCCRSACNPWKTHASRSKQVIYVFKCLHVKFSYASTEHRILTHF